VTAVLHGERSQPGDVELGACPAVPVVIWLRKGLPQVTTVVRFRRQRRPRGAQYPPERSGDCLRLGCQLARNRVEHEYPGARVQAHLRPRTHRPAKDLQGDLTVPSRAGQRPGVRGRHDHRALSASPDRDDHSLPIANHYPGRVDSRCDCPHTLFRQPHLDGSIPRCVGDGRGCQALPGRLFARAGATLGGL